jgi:eukaryotic-like serine/threonine-protein kinase
MSDRWDRIEDIYHRALECDASQRHAFLADTCAGDEALLREVESLLQHQNEAESLMEKPAVQIVAQSLAKDNGRVREGQQLGPYKILSLLGTGGMGEVYLADDTRLGRKVALKLLAPSLLNDSQSRALFMREARSVSILSHPNICTLYDIGEHDGIDFLVMEYLQGETLAKRLNRGALPIDQALRCAIEIADALDKAHCCGITHRDLKPGNIMLTKSGAKLLDFGLSKVARVEKAPSEPTGLTSKGMILGTPQYMAPEQIEGKDADARTDIFAFGSVLYEMLTGQKAFKGTNDASLMAAILEHEPPPMSSLEGPPRISVERIIKVCLAKDPEDRWQSARDLCRELKWVAESDTFPKADQERRLIGFSPFRLGLLILTVAMISGLGAWYGARRGVRQTSPILKRFVIGVLTLVDAAVPLALSPDGSKLVYLSGSFESSQIYLRTLDQLDPTPLAGTLNARDTFFSPDGQWVGFGVAAGGFRKVPVTGGPVVSLCSSCPSLAGASWGSDGMIYFGDMSGGLSKISAEGGTPEPVTALDTGRGESGHVWPQLLPNGKGILFTVLTSDSAGTSRIAVESFGANSRRIVLESGAYARYLPTGHLVYAQSGTLFAAPFDLDRIAITGPPVPVLEHVSMNSRRGSARFSFSDEGTLAFVEAVAMDQRSLVWVNRRGEREPISAPPRQFRHLSLSPDGKRLVVEVSQEGKTDLWSYDLPTGAFNRMTFDGANFPVWTPDGTKITYSSVIGGKPALLWQAADGSQRNRSCRIAIAWVSGPVPGLPTVKRWRLWSSCPRQTAATATSTCSYRMAIGRCSRSLTQQRPSGVESYRRMGGAWPMFLKRRNNGKSMFVHFPIRALPDRSPAMVEWRSFGHETGKNSSIVTAPSSWWRRSVLRQPARRDLRKFCLTTIPTHLALQERTVMMCLLMGSAS